MSHVNVEIKARSSSNGKIREILLSKHARFVGLDRQTDTYFNVSFGRLKLREGNIENHLIYYAREDKEGPKISNVTLYNAGPESSLRDILERSLGVLAVVKKEREIYFIDNVKFHLDRVKGLEDFVEIEAIDLDGSIGKDNLRDQCNYYISLFGINKENFISGSYSDLLIGQVK
jgi:predicted adenylyl cyclase CyaB